ncbi:MAG: electron transport complex subunit RsxE [Gammaproteobacteria bacterium]|nr:electron transport complex subunit RsxE [Gammaproteobacteria bacterium]
MLKKIFVEGVFTNNAFAVQLLGLCPLLAVSYNIENAIGLAIASSFVLIVSSIVIASLRNVISSNIRLPCFMLVIGSMATVVTLLTQAFAWELYLQVAIFIQIIVTNCMILNHAETVAFRTPVLVSLFSALCTALGFSLALISLGGIRQLLSLVFPVAAHPAGAFIVAGAVLALFNSVRLKFESATQPKSGDNQDEKIELINVRNSSD